MSQRRILLSWIGHNDLRAMCAALPAKQGKELLAEVGGVMPAASETGPIKTLVDSEEFDAVYFLSNYKAAWSRKFTEWLDIGANVVSVKLQNPTDYAEIFRTADEQLGKLRTKGALDNCELCIHLSPGSPAMAAIWLLLGKSRYPATFYQTYKGKAWVTEVPFDLAVDFAAEVFREPDAHLQHLLAHSPSEVAGFEQIAGDSRPIRLAVGRAKRAATRNVPVLLLGESGTGKEMFALAIHESSSRRDKSFRAVNCAAISRELLESELFGHKKGAFTGADQDRKGLFEEADGGTLFLDEIGECDPAMQATLLRVLQPPPEGNPCDRLFYRVGESTPRTSDVRIIAATNRDLITAISDGDFRDDLYYRLAAITIKLPPLRDRMHDIPKIIERLLGQINEQLHSEGPAYEDKNISDTAMIFVKKHDWPGNVRQLYNALLQAAVMANGTSIDKQDIADALAEMPSAAGGVKDVLKSPLGDGFDIQQHINDIHSHYLRRAMKETRGNKTQAAKLLGISNYQTLDAQLKRLDVTGDWNSTNVGEVGS